MNKYLFLTLLTTLLIGCGAPRIVNDAGAALPDITAALATGTRQQPITTLSTATIMPTPIRQTDTSLFTPTATLITVEPPIVTVKPIATPVNEVLVLDLKSQNGGGLTTVALVGQTAFVGQGPRLLSIDVSDPTNPRAMGHSDLLPGIVENVIIHDQTAYITANQYLMWLDISDPMNMILQGQMELPGPGIILLRNDVIYAGGRITPDKGTGDESMSYIATLDITSSPRQIDMIEFESVITALALSENSLYVGQRNNQALVRVDVTNPGEIGETVQRIGGVLDVSQLRAYGHILLVGSSNGVTAFDITNPQHPSQLWREDGPNIAQVIDLAVYGNRLFTWGHKAAGTYIPSQATIALPESLPSPDYQFSPQVVAAEDHLYIADGSLITYSITSIEPTVEGQYVPQTGGAMDASEDILYVGNDYNGLVAYSLPELVQRGVYYPVPTDELTSDSIYTIELAENRLYLTGDDELRILNANDLTWLGGVHSTENSFLLFQQSGRHVTIPVIANVLYLYSLIEGQEQIVPYDVSDPTDPLPLDVIPLDRDMRVAAMAATQQWLIVSLYTITDSTGRGQLALYDLSDNAPELAVKIDVAQTPSVLEIHNDLLVAGGSITGAEEDQLELYRLPSLNSIAQVSLPAIHDMRVVGNLALITMQHDRYLVGFDISNPATPQNVGMVEMVSNASNLAVVDDYLIAGNERMGLFAFQMNQK